MRAAAALLLTCMACSALAKSPERDKAWEAMIAEAQKHGGQETRLDKSASYVFQRPDGSYLTLTRMLAGDKRRSVCLVAEAQTATTCIDWDTGKLTLGDRADSATPWRLQTLASLDEYQAQQPGVFEELVNGITTFVGRYGRRYWEDGHWIFIRR